MEKGVDNQKKVCYNWLTAKTKEEKMAANQNRKEVIEMKFKLVPVKKKQPLKAMKKAIATVAVSTCAIAFIDDLFLNHAITKNLELFRERQQKKYAERIQEFADELERKTERARKQNQTTTRSYMDN